MKSKKDVLSLYGLRAIKIEPLTGGLVNKTWKVKTRSGVYILQWVSPIFSSLIMKDIAVVTAQLRENGLTSLEIIKTKDKKLYVSDIKGFWRVSAFISGVTYSTPYSTKIAREAGEILGKFHLALSGLKYKFQYHRPLHRESSKIYKKYLAVLKKHPDIYDKEFIKTAAPIGDLPKFFLPKTLPKRVTHGDPKIDNIIFDHKNRALTLVDLDDCGNRHNTLVDIGDFLRSLCRNANSSFSLERYKKAMKGYLKGSQGLLTLREKKLIPQSLKLITLELACRFAIDMVEDFYFSWEEKKYSSRREHNRARVLKLIKFYRDVCKHEKELRSFID